MEWTQQMREEWTQETKEDVYSEYGKHLDCCGGDYCEGDHNKKIFNWFNNRFTSHLKSIAEEMTKKAWSEEGQIFEAITIEDALECLGAGK